MGLPQLETVLTRLSQITLPSIFSLKQQGLVIMFCVKSDYRSMCTSFANIIYFAGVVMLKSLENVGLYYINTYCM